MRKFNVTVNGIVYEVEVEEVAAGAPSAPVAAPAAPKAAPAPVAPASAPAAPARPFRRQMPTALNNMSSFKERQAPQQPTEDKKEEK